MLFRMGIQSTRFSQMSAPIDAADQPSEVPPIHQSTMKFSAFSDGSNLELDNLDRYSWSRQKLDENDLP